MRHDPHSEPLSMDELLSEAVGRILDTPDLEQFLAWGRGRIPLALGGDGLDADDARRLSALLAQAIWNAVPRPDLGFRPSPLPELDPHEPCRCGSGAAYGDCCEAAGEVPELPAEILWDPLLDQLDEAQLQAAVGSDQVPRPLLAKVADRWLSLGRPGRAAALLEPLFDGDLAELDDAYEPALDILCDAYDALDHWKKKHSFLLRITSEAPAPLKSAAWQRLSVMSIDEGDFEQAAEAFERAQRHGPDHPGTALLEITLLAARHRDDHARARALFWQHKLRRAGHDGSGIYEFLDRAQEDPQQALMMSQAASMDPALLRLREWLGALVERAQTALDVEPIDDPLNCADPRQLPLFDPELLPPPPGSAARHALLRGDPGQRHGGPGACLAAGVPGRQAHVDAARRAGARAGLAARRVAGLPRRAPGGADSLEVLDDLATALHAHPESSLPWVARVMLDPVLDRAEAMLRRTASPGAPGVLPWTDPRNRPALRLLFRRYRQRAEAGDDQPP
jgi:tetratricopeptide (TPR) repeat protein